MVNMLSITLLLSLCATIYGHNEAESLTVVVNHVRLYKGNNNTDIEYRYFDGDAVELICHTTRYRGHVRMIYDYVNESQDQSRDATISWMVGLRLNLRAAHNSSRVTCRAWDDYSRLDTKVNITLILENSVEDVINLKINGLAVRPQSTREFTNLVVLFQKSLGSWAKFVSMAFECGSNNKDIVLESYPYKYGNRKETFEKLSSISRIMTVYDKFLRYVALNKTTMQLIRIIDIRFEEMPNPYTNIDHYPKLRVTLNGAPSDDMIELYAVEGLHKIYYYCEEDLSVVLNCSRREQNDERQIDYLVFDDEGKYVSGTEEYDDYTTEIDLEGKYVSVTEEYDDYTTQINLEETHSNFITKKIKLTSEDYVKELYCRRKNYYADEVKETIRVQLRRITTKTEAKKRITPTTRVEKQLLDIFSKWRHGDTAVYHHRVIDIPTFEVEYSGSGITATFKTGEMKLAGVNNFNVKKLGSSVGNTLKASGTIQFPNLSLTADNYNLEGRAYLLFPLKGSGLMYANVENLKLTFSIILGPRGEGTEVKDLRLDFSVDRVKVDLADSSWPINDVLNEQAISIIESHHKDIVTAATDALRDILNKHLANESPDQLTKTFVQIYKHLKSLL